MNILALDSSTEACSVALQRSDGEIFAEFEIAPRQHNQLLPQMMDRLITASGISKRSLSYCTFANGPGAFTGIRIAAAQAQGIGVALNLPLIPISTLALLAQTGFSKSLGQRGLVALDARMDEIYWARYYCDSNGIAQLDGDERLSNAANVELDPSIDFGAGHGWLAELSARTEIPLEPGLLPNARFLLPLAETKIAVEETVPADEITINYLRNQVAKKLVQ